MPADLDPGVAWLESPQIIGHTRWYDELSRPYTWCLPMFWLKTDTSEATAMTVPASAYDDPEWRPL
ncbi:hypothetical protein [Nonomuraea lactucae]|uniref:hypothetical protein n=1 Tax=Nonomuraea lactucae TaxID=2249762 RepID=UPI000DE4F2FE|nr:hypothetical protein [Nonomuraea lactucae]